MRLTLLRPALHRPLLTAALLLFVATPAVAGWTLDNEASTLSFVTIKADTVAETHTFDRLQGRVGDDGKARLDIALDSVNTGIEVRDERMREMLFETAAFPTATVQLAVPAETLDQLGNGAMTSVTVEAEVSVHGASQPVTASLSIAKLGEDRLLVASTRPLLIDAGKVGLADGVERLREVAGLTSISPAVPVSFVLCFVRD